MKKSLIVLALILISAFAHAEEDTCYQNEINPRTRKAYANRDDWNLDLQEWTEKEPEHPGYLNLWRAYNAYKGALAVANMLKKDKQAHCYMGCVIRHASDQKTVIYSAWLKESRDLQDCNKGTHFEEADMTATIAGGEMGDLSSPDQCLYACQRAF